MKVVAFVQYTVLRLKLSIEKENTKVVLFVSLILKTQGLVLFFKHHYLFVGAIFVKVLMKVHGI